MYFLGFFILIILAFGIPILASFLLLKYFQKKGYSNRVKLIATIPILILGFLVYGAIFPDNDFFKDDFNEITGLDLPKGVNFVFKTASYPDNHGDYTSVGVVEVDKEFFKKVESELPRIGYSLMKEVPIESFELIQGYKRINKKDIESHFGLDVSGKTYYVGLLNDQMTIIFQRLSW